MDADNQLERALVLARRLQLGTCRLDRALNEVHDGDRRSRLMPKAAAVLEVLIHFAGEPVSKERLLAEVWRGEFPTEDVVTNAISQLRKAFGDDARDPRYIRTVSRVGYVLLADVAPLADERSAGEFGVQARVGDIDPCIDPCIETRSETRIDACIDIADASIDAIALDIGMASASPQRPLRALHAGIVLLLILLALAIGILIGNAQWRAAHVPHRVVPLSEQSAPTRVTYRHATLATTPVVSFSCGFRRDGVPRLRRCSSHRQGAKEQAWT